MKMDKQDVQVVKLAQEILPYFGRMARLDEEIVVLMDETPAWIKAVCQEAHGDLLPDDWRYEFIKEAIHLIADASEDDILEDLHDRMEADIYNNELLKWVGSNLNRISYCDDAKETYGGGGDLSFMDLISIGQLWEKHEVFHLVLNGLRSRLEDLETTEAESKVG